MNEDYLKIIFQVLHPRLWTREMNEAWHKAIPDVYAAFEALRSFIPKEKITGMLRANKVHKIIELNKELIEIWEQNEIKGGGIYKTFYGKLGFFIDYQESEKLKDIITNIKKIFLEK